MVRQEGLRLFTLLLLASFLLVQVRTVVVNFLACSLCVPRRLGDDSLSMSFLVLRSLWHPASPVSDQTWTSSRTSAGHDPLQMVAMGATRAHPQEAAPCKLGNSSFILLRRFALLCFCWHGGPGAQIDNRCIADFRVEDEEIRTMRQHQDIDESNDGTELGEAWSQRSSSKPVSFDVSSTPSSTLDTSSPILCLRAVLGSRPCATG